MSQFSLAMSLYASDGQRKYLTEAERVRFLASAEAAEPKVRTLCLTLAYTGCRISEALNLTANDVQLHAALIAIRCLKKRGKLVVREVPVPPALLYALQEVHQIGRHQISLPSADALL